MLSRLREVVFAGAGDRPGGQEGLLVVGRAPPPRPLAWHGDYITGLDRIRTLRAAARRLGDLWDPR